MPAYLEHTIASVDQTQNNPPCARLPLTMSDKMRTHTFFQGINIDEVAAFQARKGNSLAEVKIRTHSRRLPACIRPAPPEEP